MTESGYGLWPLVVLDTVLVAPSRRSTTAASATRGIACPARLTSAADLNAPPSRLRPVTRAHPGRRQLVQEWRS
jgi:hypothetical protein